MTLYNTLLGDWGVDTKRITSVNDVRLRYIPVLYEKKTPRSTEFKHGIHTYFVKTAASFSKGTNGRVYPAFRILEERGERRFLPMIVKKMPARLHSLREAVIQRAVQEQVGKHVPTVYATLRSKNNIWLFMQDLRTPVAGADKAQSLHCWFASEALRLTPAAFRIALSTILKTIFAVLLRLHETLKLSHGDLHPANIFVHTDETGSQIHRVFLLDFGYSMMHDGGNQHCTSPYWES